MQKETEKAKQNKKYTMHSAQWGEQLRRFAVTDKSLGSGHTVLCSSAHCRDHRLGTPALVCVAQRRQQCEHGHMARTAQTPDTEHWTQEAATGTMAAWPLETGCSRATTAATSKRTERGLFHRRGRVIWSNVSNE